MAIVNAGSCIHTARDYALLAVESIELTVVVLAFVQIGAFWVYRMTYMTLGRHSLLC